MFFTKTWFRVLWLLISLGAVIFSFSQLKVESSLLKLLPQYASKQTNELINTATERVNRQLLLMASSEHESELIKNFTKELQNIENNAFVSTLRYQVDWPQIQQVYQTLNPYQANLISAADRQAFNEKLPADYFILQAQENLYGVQQFSKEQLISDPLFLWQRFTASLADLNVMSFETSQAYFQVNKNELHHMVAFVELTDSAFSPTNQSQVAQSVTTMKSNLATKGIEMAAFGAVLYAHQGFTDAKKEISTVGLGSLLGIVLLVMWVFRSVLPLILCISCIALGLITALAIALLVFDSIHAFALVFGATIAGVSIDYSFHYLVVDAFNKNLHNDQTNSLPESNTAQNILPGLVMGFISSALVYLGFLITGYAVLAQIALFSVLGLLAVLINVLVLFPWLHRSKGFAHPEKVLSLTQSILNNPVQKRFKTTAVPVVLLIITTVTTYFWLKPNDDIKALQQLSPTLVKQEAYIREVLDWSSTDAYVLVSAENINEMLTVEAQVLTKLRQQGHQVVGVSDYIPSLNQQQNQHQLIQDLYQTDKVKSFVAALEIDPIAWVDFKPMPVDILAQPAFATLFKQRWLGEVNDQQALIIPLQKPAAWINDSFNQQASSYPITTAQVTLIQQAKDTSFLFAQFRVNSSWMLAAAGLFLWLMLGLFRYGLISAAHLISIPMLAGFMSLVLTYAVGLHVSLFSVLALLLVLGMGLDYVIFLRESDEPKEVMLALCMSCTTTILAFGLLTFSQVAVLKSFGFMVGMGIAMVLILSPAVLKESNNT